MLVCGMAMGYALPDAQANELQTDREAVQGFTRFHE